VRFIGYLFLPLLFLLPQTALSEGPPRFSIDDYEHDFGRVSQGTTVTHKFKFKNGGEGHLIIQRTVAACGCTVASLEQDAFTAGESGELEVKFDTTGFSGEKVKTVRVYTNDPDQRSFVLSLRGTIEPDVVVEPRRVFFGDVVSGEGGSRDVSIKIRDGASARIQNVQLHSNHFDLQEIESGDKHRLMRVVLRPDVSPGEIRERIVIGLRGDKRQSVNIPLYASVKGALQMSPTTLSFGVIEGESVLSRRVRINNLGRDDFEISDIAARHQAITVKKTVIEEGKIVDLEVSLDPLTVEGELRTGVEITTNHPDQKRLSLSVYGTKPPVTR